jgi:hypothetical protein
MKDTFPQPSEFKGAVAGTILYLALYLFVFIQFQAYSKFYLLAKKKAEARSSDGNAAKVSLRAVKYYNSRDTIALAGDRCVGNFGEQAILFLPLLWMHAVFVDPSQSFAICAWYTAFRSYHPIMFFLPLPMIFLSTIPGYGILMYLMHQLVFKFLLA